MKELGKNLLNALLGLVMGLGNWVRANILPLLVGIAAGYTAGGFIGFILGKVF